MVRLRLNTIADTNKLLKPLQLDYNYDYDYDYDNDYDYKLTDCRTDKLGYLPERLNKIANTNKLLKPFCKGENDFVNNFVNDFLKPFCKGEKDVNTKVNEQAEMVRLRL